MMRRNKDWFWPWTLGAGIVLAAGGIGLYLLRGEAPQTEPVVDAPARAVDTPAALPPPVAVTVPPEERVLPLPPLDESDPDMLGGLTEIFGQQAVMQYLVPERIVRNLVVSIDNLPRQQMALNQRPIQPASGDFVTAGPEEAMVIAPENYPRYEPFAALVRALDAKTVVSLYRGMEPLFQQAYEELGHPDAEFDKRLIEVIEHLLAAPNPPGPIRLVQPSVLYRYADERLEKLSAGQKLLVRMGPANAGIIKAKLREIQAELL